MKTKQIYYILMLILLFAACKYEDGPLISFRSKVNRLLGIWQVENVKVDGVDSTQRYNDSCGCTLKFVSDDNYIGIDIVILDNCKNYYGGGNDFRGDWLFENKNKILTVWFDKFYYYYEGYGPIGWGKHSNWEILKLTNKRFWFKTNFNNKEYIFKLKYMVVK